MLKPNFSTQPERVIFSQNETSNNASKSLQITAQIVNILNFSFCLWVFLSLKKFVKHKNKLMIASNNLRRKIIVLSACTPIVPLIRILSSQAVLSLSWFISKRNDRICEIVVDTSIVLYYIALLPVFIFLWVKQRFLYKQPSMRHLNTIKLKILSYFSVFLVSVAGMVICILFVLPNSFIMVPPSMECRKNTEVVPIVNDKIYHVSSMTAILGTQLILFLLFVYPLLMYKKSKSMNKNRLVTKKITATLKHAAISNVIMTSSIVLTLILLTTVLDGLPNYIRNSFYDFGTCFILFSVVISFKNWKKIFTFSIHRTSMTRKSTTAGYSRKTVSDKNEISLQESKNSKKIKNSLNK